MLIVRLFETAVCVCVCARDFGCVSVFSSEGTVRYKPCSQ